MSSYPYYSYGPQQIYSQQAPMMGQAGSSGGYMPIYAPPATSYAPAQTPFIPPGAMIETPPATQSQPLNTKNRAKHSHRAATTPLPLKSALKKPAAAGGAPAPVAALYAEPVQPRRHTSSKVKPEKYAAVPLANEVSESSDKGESCPSFISRCLCYNILTETLRSYVCNL